MEALITPVVYALVALFKDTIPKKWRDFIPYLALALGGILSVVWGLLNGQAPLELFETLLTGVALGLGATGLDNAAKARKDDK